MMNTKREWDWMDDEEYKKKNYSKIFQELEFTEDKVGDTFVKLIKDDEWDYYSGLPNPKWYEDDEYEVGNLSDKPWTYISEYRRYRGNEHELYYEGKWIKVNFNDEL